ncbi:kinase-like protein [Suillus decipiens]|nr:kinase-like protein [Suillus decipiens]
MSLSTLQNLTNQITRKDPYPQEGGAFGTVWRCILRTDSTEIEVAVKTLRVHSNRRKENMYQELIIWRRLHHENIVPLLGIASGFGPDNSISMVSTWFTNGTLTSYLASQHDTLHRRQRFELLRDIAAGLQYLHASQVVHGDLSGNNVLINGQGKACLTDFGLSTASGGFQGTSYFGQAGRHGAIRWVAPEIIVGAGQHSTFDSDVYSFGSIMLQVLSGEVPWSEVAAEHVIVQKLTNGQVPRRPPPVSRTHWAFIRKCWSPIPRNAVRPSSRPSASEIVDFLKNSQIHVRRSPDFNLRRAAQSMVQWVNAQITRPAGSGSDRALRGLKDCATNFTTIQGNTKSSSNEIPNEDVISHAFAPDGTRNIDTDVENMNNHLVISQDVDINHQTLQASASTSKHFVFEKKKISQDFEGDLVNELDRLHAFPVTAGSSGDIWQCHLYTADLGKVQVAVKALCRFNASQSDSFRRKLLRESQCWVKLKHRNIVYTYGMTSGFSVFPAVVTTWMRNGTLTEYLDQQYSYLTPRGRLHLLNDVASGLCYLHSQKIVHGDLTGSNVLMDEDGRACLADYGLALIVASSTDMRTSTTETCNSPNAARWAAPELFLGEDETDFQPTVSSDVYSFGCIMLQILVGRLPYWWAKRSIHVTIAKTREALPMRHDPDVPKLEESHQIFLKRCWVSLPLSRPSSLEAVEFVAAELRGLT